MQPDWAKGLLKRASQLFSIPIIGIANCGPATIFAEENFHGFLQVSSKLIGRSKPSGLYAVKADGTSMNRADIGGRKIFDGDFVIVNSQKRNVISGDQKAILRCWEHYFLIFSCACLIFLHLPTRLGKEKRPPEPLPATLVLSGGGDRTRTCIAFRPAVFKTAALPLCDPSAGGGDEYNMRGITFKPRGIALTTRIMHDLS